MDETTNTNSVGADKEALKQAIQSATTIEVLKEGIQKAMDSGFTNDSEFIEIAKSKHQELVSAPSVAAEETQSATVEVKVAEQENEPVTEPTPTDEVPIIDTSTIVPESEPENVTQDVAAGSTSPEVSTEPEIEASAENTIAETPVTPVEEPAAAITDTSSSTSSDENNTDDIAALVASQNASGESGDNPENAATEAALPSNDTEPTSSTAETTTEEDNSSPVDNEYVDISVPVVDTAVIHPEMPTEIPSIPITTGDADVVEEAADLPVENDEPAIPAVGEEGAESAETSPLSPLADEESSEPSETEAEPEKKKEEVKDIILDELKKQFNEAMGDLVVLAADASDLTEHQKTEAGLLGEKVKYTWGKIVEKRLANENMHIDDQNKYIANIVDKQMKKVGS